MPLNIPANIEPLHIIAYHSEERGDGSPVLTEVDRFDAQYCPSNYAQRYVNVFEGVESIGINVSLPSSRYAFSMPSELSFKLIIDSDDPPSSMSDSLPTPSLDNPLGGADEEGVMEAVNQFLAVCYDYDGEIHQPRFLTVEWATLSASCRLRSVDIQYTMFSREGIPSRAELDVVFIGDVSEDIRVRQENRQSPDLNKRVTVIEGQSLPLISEKAYGSASYYLKLAKYNRLNHFREINPGMELSIPPLEELLALT